MRAKILLVAVLIGMCAGCASKSDVQYQRSEIKTMKRNIKLINLKTGEEYTTAQLIELVDAELPEMQRNI